MRRCCAILSDLRSTHPKVAAERKKLTIFFSDIANFTESTDRLASEELTNLLN